jgi:predicted glycosyltransferase involved in capsule biosynthesis
MISFVFYTHSKRLDNLLQTLRFLKNREPNLEKEIIVVFQDNGPSIEGVIKYDLNMDTYQKPKMCNFGVSQCKHSIIALMDSDRILSANYFTDICRVINYKQFITCSTIKQILIPKSDDQLDFLTSDFIIEERSQINKIRSKNLFSGNTVFWKRDYEVIGGMDENYVGYGYADNDMTQTILSAGMEQIYLSNEELHLYHEEGVFYKKEKMTDAQIFGAINVLKYSLKWKIKDKIINKICNEVSSKLANYPEELQAEFLSLLNWKVLI